MLKSIGVNLINAFWSIETVDINRFNNAIIEKVNFNSPQLWEALINQSETHFRYFILRDVSTYQKASEQWVAQPIET